VVINAIANKTQANESLMVGEWKKVQKKKDFELPAHPFVCSCPCKGKCIQETTRRYLIL